MTGCRCDHPGHPDWHNFDCPVGLPALPPVETEVVQVLRALVAMNKALIAREHPVRDVAETWAWARSVLSRADKS